MKRRTNIRITADFSQKQDKQEASTATFFKCFLKPRTCYTTKAYFIYLFTIEYFNIRAQEMENTFASMQIVSYNLHTNTNIF